MGQLLLRAIITACMLTFVACGYSSDSSSVDNTVLSSSQEEAEEELIKDYLFEVQK